MSISKETIKIAELDVEVVRKNIKNLHLAVYPPEGRVRVAVPKNTSDDNVRMAIISRLSWIKKQQKALAKQSRLSERQFVSGESHFFNGRRYLLEVIERRGKHEVKIKNNNKLLLYVNPGTTTENRSKVIHRWYREYLSQLIPDLLEKWQPTVGRKTRSWGVKKMKTKWGSCNISAKRIWINLELAKKPPECLEYIVVHELVHLQERLHNDRFKAIMDKVMPSWRFHRDILKSEPLAHEHWQ